MSVPGRGLCPSRGEAGRDVRAPPGRYRLGPAAAHIGMKAMASTLDPPAARLALDRLGRTVDGFALLWALSPYGGARKVCTASSPGRYDWESLGLNFADLTEIGQSLRVGAAGRAIAAHLPPFLLNGVVEQPLPPRCGPGAVRSATEFTKSLMHVRETGYAIDREEIAGWAAVAAPVLWGGTAYGAVCVLKPSSLMPEDSALPVNATLTAAERLSMLAAGHMFPAPLAG